MKLSPPAFATLQSQFFVVAKHAVVYFYAQELLYKNVNRKQMAVEAAALVASQRGLLEAITLVVSNISVLNSVAMSSTTLNLQDTH